MNLRKSKFNQNLTRIISLVKLMAIIKILEEKINQKKDEINLFFIKKYQQFSGKTLYNSFDIRHSDNKIAVVDSNCFPAGFNNIKVESLKITKLKKKYVEIKLLTITYNIRIDRLQWLLVLLYTILIFIILLIIMFIMILK